ncbi:MAG: hypothetical protein Q4Q07_00915 [Tissierellia bacterium]|nr:hypothetical protein [Tissierellia bacterium]
MNKFAPYDYSSFQFSCEGTHKSCHPVNYQLEHNPTPIKLSSEMTEAIEYLLWYVPNINSLQSKSNPLVEKILYDDFTFDLIRKEMELTTDDILIEEEIPFDVYRYFRHKICTNCQKLVLTRAEEETKSASLLRHIRNAIAHGLFTIVDEMLMAFDFRNMEDAKEDKNCTAIIKIRPRSLLQALKKIDTELTHEHLAAKAFQEAGYCLKRTKWKDKGLPYDFEVEKEGRFYGVEIKKFDTPLHMEPIEVKKVIKGFEHIKDIPLVLLSDSSYLKKESKQLLKTLPITILDMENIEDLLQGHDVLKSIEKGGNKS